MFAAVHLQYRKLTVFILLSVLDLILTCQLVQSSDGLVYESNPVASAWLANYGWAGLVIFKAGMVVLIGLTALFISRYRPQTSGRLLVFACSVTAGVVVYSFYLTQLVAAAPHQLNAGEMSSFEDDGILMQMVENKRRHHAYLDLMDRLGSEVISRELTLDEAVDKLAGQNRGSVGSWLRLYRVRYPGLSEREYMAVHIVDHALAMLGGGTDESRQTANELGASYRETFGKSIPIDVSKVGPRLEWYARRGGG